MIKQLILALIAVLACQPTSAQLRADAGPDMVWCTSFGRGAPPQLGGTVPASGGVAPYTYTWQTIGLATPAYYYLDNVTAAHPRLVAGNVSPGPDFVFFHLHITDSTGATADDTVKVYFSRLISYMADIPVPKHLNDTVRLKPGSDCASNFWPLTFLHWDTSIYLADSTDPYTRCWCPIDYFFYRASFTDRAGCPVSGGVTIYISQNGVANQAPESTGITVVPNPITLQSELQCSAAWIGGTFILSTTGGKEIGRCAIHSTRTPLRALLPTAAGIYSYRVIAPSGRQFCERVVKQ